MYPAGKESAEYPRREGYILGGHSTGHSKQKLNMYICPILNGFRDIANSLYNSLDFVPNIVLPSRM
jgi:hypothetical protein